MINFDNVINPILSFELPESARTWGLSKADHSSKITNPGGLCFRGFVFCAAG